MSRMSDALRWYAIGQGDSNPTFSTETAGGIETLKTWACPTIPRPTDEEIAGIIEEYEETKEYACQCFNSDLAIARINSELSVRERNDLMPYLAGIKAYMDYPAPLRNFEEMKASLEDLVDQAKISAAQYAKIKEVLLEQNINLEDY